MLQVLIVEDERPTARVIGKLVEQNPAFHVAGIESNGERAIRFLQQTPVDVVITDIQMPIMDGLQLLKILHRDFPRCLTILLTGFSQFEYAKTALQYRAFDYLLKPVDSASLHQCLNKAERRLRELDYECEHRMLEQALAGLPPTDSTQAQYSMILATLSPDFLQTLEADSWQNTCHLFYNYLDSLSILLLPVGKQKLLLSLLIEHTDCAVYSTNPLFPAQLSQAVQHLKQQLEQRARIFCANFLPVDTTQPFPIRKVNPLLVLEPERAVEAICARDAATLNAALQHMWQKAAEFGNLQTDVFSYFHAILMDRRICRPSLPGVLRQMERNLRQIVQSAPDAPSCTDALCEALLSLLAESTAKRDAAAIAQEIAQYLQANYHQNITIEALARQYGFVPNYLNKIFKTHLGVRPSEYLLDIRIRQAKRMLEASPDILIKDVAANVGYSDHHYFSRVFQRATGEWPTEYQQHFSASKNSC